jgi:hypothetical protein
MNDLLTMLFERLEEITLTARHDDDDNDGATCRHYEGRLRDSDVWVFVTASDDHITYWTADDADSDLADPDQLEAFDAWATEHGLVPEPLDLLP